MPLIQAVRQHVRGAYRSLIRAPGFAATAILTLTLGIGLSTAVFTIADAVLLRRLPVGHQERLAVLWGETRDGRFANFPLALTDIRELERQSRSLAAVAFFAFRGATPMPIRVDGRAYPVEASLVSGNFFDVLQSRPILGRTLHAEDDVAGAAPVLVLSHRAWQQRFGGDTAIVGRSVSLLSTGRSYTIVGVMPQGLDYPNGTDVWFPLVAHGAAGGFLDVVTGELDILARLRVGASHADARNELTSFFVRPGAPGHYRDVRGVVHSLADVTLGDTRPAVLLIMLAAALLLLITCVNVANLLIVRALGRMREFVVRAALGAHRGQLVAQLLAESALLSLAGGLLGVGLAVGGVRAFVAGAPQSIPRIDEVGVSSSALVAALLITTTAMLLSGVWPALFTSRADALDALRSGARNTGGRRLTAAAEALVVAQIALAVVSLTAAGLVTRSFIKLQQVDLSFNPERLLVASLTMQQDRFTTRESERAALDLVLRNTQALPGVEGVTPVFTVPFTGAGGGVDGRFPKPGESDEQTAATPMLNLEMAAPNYFAMLGIPLLKGRFFREDDRDGTVPVIVVSNSVARYYWPAADAVGQRLASGGREYTVVGVVPDTRYRELTAARPTVYFPIGQLPFGGMVPSTMLIRVATEPTAVVPAIRRVVAAADPRMSVVSISSLDALLDGPRARPRLNAVVLALFATSAVALAAIGLFAIITTMVRQRTHELGIRMALGATAGRVCRMVMVRGLSIAVVGLATGTAGAVAVAQLLSTLVFEISPMDPLTFAATAALMLAIAAVASFIPARVSMRIDPVSALRGDG